MNRDEIYGFFQNLGYQPHHIAGIMGNIGAESNFNPTAFNPAGGGQGALGFAQWRGSRQSALRDLATKRGTDVHDGLTQLTHLHNELMGPENAAYQALLKTDNAADAARVFRDTFERPGGHGYENTHRFAQEVAARRGAAPGGEYQQAYRMPEQYSMPAGESGGYGMPTMIDPDQLDMGMLADEVQKAQMRQDILQGFFPQDGGLPSFANTEYADPQTVQAQPDQPPMPDAGSVDRLLGQTDAEPFGPSAARSPDEFQYQAQDAMLDEAEKEVVAQANSILTAPEDYDTGTVEGAKSIIDEPDDTPDEAAEKKAKRRRWAMMLGTLSKGLGQMSVGQAVDVTGVPMEFERMAMEGQAQENRNRLAAIQEQRLGQRLSLDQQKFIMDQAAAGNARQAAQASSGIFASAGMTDLAQAAAAGVPMKGLWDTYNARMDTQEQRGYDLQDAERKFNEDLYMEQLKLDNSLTKEQFKTDLDNQQGALLQNAIAANQAGQQPMLQNMSPQTLKDYYDITADPQKSTMWADAVAAAEARTAAGTPSTPGQVLDEWRSKSATEINIGGKKGDEKSETLAAEAHRTRMANYEEMSATASESQIYLDDMREVNQAIIDSGGQTSVASPILAKISGVMEALGQDAVKSIIEGVGGISYKQFTQMDSDQQALAFAIARQNKGQGSITENERKAILAQVPNVAGDPEATAKLIERATFLNKVDQAMQGKYYEKTDGGKWRLGDEASIYLNSKVKPSMSRMSQLVTSQNLANRGMGDFPEIPTLTAEEADFYGPILKEAGLLGYMTPDGQEVEF